MRKLIVSNAIDAYNAERLRAADTLLGRVSLDDRPDCIGQWDAGIQRTASGYPSAHRHTHVAWLRERTPTL
jgi:hypothetical protein